MDSGAPGDILFSFETRRIATILEAGSKKTRIRLANGKEEIHYIELVPNLARLYTKTDLIELVEDLKELLC